MHEGLCHDIALRPFMGGYKVALIDDADYLNAEGANCLLKTLEEPPPRSVLILIGTSPAKQLPTIRSRIRPKSSGCLSGCGKVLSVKTTCQKALPCASRLPSKVIAPSRRCFRKGCG